MPECQSASSQIMSECQLSDNARRQKSDKVRRQRSDNVRRHKSEIIYIVTAMKDIHEYDNL